MASDSFSRQVAQWQKQLDAKAARMNQVEDQQRPQFPEDRHGPGYRNDAAHDWRGGFGKDGRESAEDKPGFDHSQSRLAHTKGRKDRGWTDDAEGMPGPKKK